MVLKKPAILLYTNAFNTIACSGPSVGGSSSPFLFPSLSHKPRRQRRQCRRSYAAAHDIYTHPFHQDHYIWPETKHPQHPPTPYQIFNQQRDEPYSKRRFYELVKIYHPDRNKHLEDPGNEQYKIVLLERYRMIINANAILSDPDKKSAYDKYGAGWISWGEGMPSQSGNHPRYTYTTHHRWRHSNPNYSSQWRTEDDPMFNATWEDWERWYYQMQFSGGGRPNPPSWSSTFFNPGRPRGLYGSNYAFMSVLFILAALGGVGQATRLDRAAESRSQKINSFSEETSKHLIKAREDSQGHAGEGEDKRARIRRMLRERDGYEEGEFDGRALKDGDDGMCNSGFVKDKDDLRFWEKPPER